MTAARSAVVQRLALEDFPRPEIARALSPNGRAHWTAKKKAREQVEEIAALAMLHQRLGSMDGPVRITYRWIVPNHRKRDLDNHSTGVVKALQDAFVKYALLDADDTSCIVAITIEITVERGRRALEITLEEVR